jgi:hypothetical protein
MSWGVQVDNVELFFPRIYKEEVDVKIEENEKTISTIEKELLMYAIANPVNITSKESKKEGCVVEDLMIKIDELLETYRNCISNNTKLYIIKEYINTAINC